MTGPITVVGGKTRLAKTIIQILPPHDTYVEPFAGGAQVFFHKRRAKVEVLNDLDGEIMNFLRVCQVHPQEFVRSIRYHVVSRKWFELLKQTEPATLTDIQRAVRFFYIRRNVFGGQVLKPSFGFVVTGRSRFEPAAIPNLIAKVHERLQGVQLECRPYHTILKTFDTDRTVFYLDPPYWGLPYYNHNFTAADFAELASHLCQLRGKFVLSINNVPEIHRLFRSFTITTVDLAYTCLPKHKRKRNQELLIHNFVSPAVSDVNRERK
jgi:DNA adenine methylase